MFERVPPSVNIMAGYIDDDELTRTKILKKSTKNSTYKKMPEQRAKGEGGVGTRQKKVIFMFLYFMSVPFSIHR